MKMVSEGCRRAGVRLRGRGRSFAGKPIEARCLAVLLGLLLLLAPAAVWAGDMEGPLGGTHRLGAPPADDYRLERIRFENDGEWLRMTIPIKAPWAHWTLSDPPRIIVDLGQTTSHLSNAPGLYQARLDRGPVRALRTSQFLYSPLDHRVRITLDLSEVVAYQARRVGDEIQILIPDRGVRTPRAVVIGPTGMAGIGSDPALPNGSVSASAGGAATGPMAATLTPQTRPSAPRPDAVPPEVVAGETAPAEENSMPKGSLNAGPRPPAPTLREALAAFGDIGIEPEAEDEIELPSVPPVQEGVPPASVAAYRQNGPASRQRGMQLLPSVAVPGAGVLRPPRPRSAGTHTTPVPASSPKTRASSPSSPTASVRELPPPLAGGKAAGAWTEEGSVDSAPVTDPKERSSARLLRQAVLSTLRGDLKAAAVTAERAYRFYAGTESGDQCGLLAREIYLLLGRPADADRLMGLSALPDTTRLPRALYLSFVDQYRRSGDLGAVDRVLRQWGPVYAPLPGLGALQYSIGEAFLRAGDAAEAEKHLRQVPPGDSLHVPALLLIALGQDRRGEREAALEIYRQVTALGPGPYQARGLARTADLEFQLGRVREALASYERLLQSSPPRDEEVWAVYQAGNCHLLLGESERAKERYETVARLWPRSFWAPFVKERLEEMTWRAQWASGNIAQ